MGMDGSCLSVEFQLGFCSAIGRYVPVMALLWSNLRDVRFLRPCWKNRGLQRPFSSQYH